MVIRNIKNKKNLVREFRKIPTLSEKILWHCLKNRNFLELKFRRQYIIDGFIIDLYCHQLKLAIEIDGSIHLKQTDYDKKRQNIIEQHGIIFFRINNKSIEQNVEGVMDNLEKFINNNLKIN
ncbi:MAG: endonuclease domain-containing protein [Candidatus Falkowbacteria bacterium]